MQYLIDILSLVKHSLTHTHMKFDVSISKCFLVHINVDYAKNQYLYFIKIEDQDQGKYLEVACGHLCAGLLKH